ncbi:MAG TPA: Gfo/Idh/MocA family oxidoreductase [Chthoniobacterales bacterium]|nr:Gfo/Idh/MocA family oxidoreductase [Chthoniobacterales bacterium]
MPKRRTLSVALLGTKFMGRAHSNAWRQAPRFFDLPADIRMVAICGRDHADTRRAAKMLGWERAIYDWEAITADPNIDIVDICTPNDSHAEIAIAATRAGKAILCEKPLARNSAEARRMVDAVKRSRVPNMVFFNYRRVPAVALAKQIITAGEIGERIYHFRARYAQDWIVDENFPMVWRLQSKIAGSGALGDIGAHIIDLARFLVGEIAVVSAIKETFVKRRLTKSRSYARVDVDDAVSVVGKFKNGAMLNLEATRFAPGRKNQLNFEINGSRGSLAFDLEKMNRLRFYDSRDPAYARGFRDIIVTDPTHPYIRNWWPTGHVIGYEHSFIHTIADFVNAIVARRPIQPDFADGLKTQRVVDLIQRATH